MMMVVVEVDVVDVVGDVVVVEVVGDVVVVDVVVVEVDVVDVVVEVDVVDVVLLPKPENTNSPLIATLSAGSVHPSAVYWSESLSGKHVLSKSKNLTFASWSHPNCIPVHIAVSGCFTPPSEWPYPPAW